MSDPETVGIAEAVARAEFACALAKRLLMFPLAPQPGDTLEQHAACLEFSYAQEIVSALEREAARRIAIANAALYRKPLS